MENTIWSVLAGIISGILSGTITAHIAVNHLTVRNKQSQRAMTRKGNATNVGGHYTSGGSQNQTVHGGRDARAVGRDDNSSNAW